MLQTATPETKTPEPRRRVEPLIEPRTQTMGWGGHLAGAREQNVNLQRTYGNQAVLRSKKNLTPLPPSRSGLIQRKCACGNGAGTCAQCQQQVSLQTKLRISEPGDPYEQEADRIAGEVISVPEPLLQKVPTPLPVGQSPTEVPPIVQEALNTPGESLDPATQAFMKSRFGHDFSQVRIHTDSKAAESAKSINSLAYTVKQDVVFGTQQYAPNTQKGRQLLAHELTHVVQQQHQPMVQRQQIPSPGTSAAVTSFTLNITTQIAWAITALSIRPVREEETWVCLGGAPEYDKPRILLNYLIQFQGNNAFAQLVAQRPPAIDLETYLDSVSQYLWSLLRDQFMVMIADRMRRNSSFRVKVERAAGGEGCGRVPYLESGDTAIV
ncbi:DUF4157 domain-containing protein [Candidatus Cyanaurora vandensis]|uniref:eCIS core domain-containing protein n=1 Tax=Candidatus Cyanaurora vandensis TaxID=2714958 RepID=UPI00257CC516|nr:DUF4157 domain-containing protein [Candidatus Cyanaurora vandensis]